MALECWVALRVTVSVPYFLIIGFGKGVTPQLRRLYLSILFESFGSENTVETFVGFDHQFLNFFYMNTRIITF